MLSPCVALRAEAPSTSSLPAIATHPPATQDERMAWFREAKYGLFIHWGLYSIPAGTWKGKPIPGIGEWIMNRGEIPVQEYEKLAAQFNPVKFDAEAWVRLAKEAGMKYVVITSKHHDGFALYDSDASRFDVVDATPFKRDIIHELAAACAKHGLRFGLYYSQAQDWHDPNGAGNTWDFGPDDKKDFDQYLRSKAEPQVKELLSNYGPICLVWFDTPRMMSVGDRAQRFADIVRSLQPWCLIDGRLGTEGDYMSTPDNVIPDEKLPKDWETPATLNHTWGFKSYDHDWKSPSQVLFNLVDIVSKGGNYLLNVGPTAEGVIPPESQNVLRVVGDWLQTNSEAIYGAKASPFGEEYGVFSDTLKGREGKPLFLLNLNWRYTMKPGKLYLHLFKSPRGRFELPAMKNKITQAYYLSDATRKPLKLVTTPDGRATALDDINPPAEALDSVICLEFEGDTIVR